MVMQCLASSQITHCFERLRCSATVCRAENRDTVSSATVVMIVGHQHIESLIGEEQKPSCIAAKVGGTCSKRADLGRIKIYSYLTNHRPTTLMSCLLRQRRRAENMGWTSSSLLFSEDASLTCDASRRFPVPRRGTLLGLPRLKGAKRAGCEVSADFTLLETVIWVESNFLNTM